MQALEVGRPNLTVHITAHIVQLMRGKRNFTRTAVHAAPRPFLFIALNKSGLSRMVTHLVRGSTNAHGQFF